MFGYKQEAISIYEKVSQSFLRDGQGLFLYGRELLHSGQNEKAIFFLNQAKETFCNDQIYILLGNAHDEIGQRLIAKNYFQKAVYMIPKKMNSRFELMNHYLKWKDTVNARVWANSILNMKIKVHSEATFRIKEKTAEILRKM